MYAGEGGNQYSNGGSNGPFSRRMEKIGKEGNRQTHRTLGFNRFTIHQDMKRKI